MKMHLISAFIVTFGTFLLSSSPIQAQGAQYECYPWSEQDMKQWSFEETDSFVGAIENLIKEVEIQKQVCEGHGYVFSQGNDTLAPGCGACSCCQPKRDKCMETTCMENTLLIAEDEYNNYDLITPSECQSRCQNDSGCKFFVFNPRPSQAEGKGNCGLRHFTPSARARWFAGSISGLKNEPFVEWTGKPDFVWVGRLETVHNCEACLNLCKGDSKCNSMTFSTVDKPKGAKGQCTLNYGIGELNRITAPGISSAKTCTGVQYKCYPWSEQDMKQWSFEETDSFVGAIENLIKEVEIQKQVCEGHGNVFSQGNDTLAPGCGACSCCRPYKP